MKSISVNLLETIFARIIEKLREFEKLEQIEIDRDTYRYIPTNQWQSYSSKEDPFIGSLYENLDKLEELVNDPDRVVNYYDLDRVASILNFISEKENPVNGVPFQD